MVLNNDNYLMVDFETYCKTCEHKDRKENEQPCCECLEHPTNLHSRKPVKWEEK